MTRLFTEETVSHRWCPFSRVSTEGSGGGFNRFAAQIDAIPSGARCIGKKCMCLNEISISDPKRFYCGLTTGG